MKEDLVRELMDRAGTDVSGKWMSRDHARVFAQLIVEECIGKYDEWAEHSTDKTSFAMARHNVKKHFGVEE
jgi:hypothetical protein